MTRVNWGVFVTVFLLATGALDYQATRDVIVDAARKLSKLPDGQP